MESMSCLLGHPRGFKRTTDVPRGSEGHPKRLMPPRGVATNAKEKAPSLRVRKEPNSTEKECFWSARRPAPPLPPPRGARGPSRANELHVKNIGQKIQLLSISDHRVRTRPQLWPPCG